MNCFETHPPLPISIKDNLYYINGGNCLTPHTQFDVLISLDRQYHLFKKSHFNRHFNKELIEFFINDFSVPSDIKEFKYLLHTIKNKIEQNKNVYIGCIGGHGRTGLVLAGLLQYINLSNQSVFNQDDKSQSEIREPPLSQNNNNGQPHDHSVIDYIREHYCSHAVETEGQILFLHYFFNISLPKEEKLKMRNILQDDHPFFKSNDTLFLLEPHSQSKDFYNKQKLNQWIEEQLKHVPLEHFFYRVSFKDMKLNNDQPENQKPNTLNLKTRLNP